MNLRVAVLDLYEGQANEGMRCIRQILKDWAKKESIELFLKEFDVRLQQQVPDLSFDLYISSGGPGSPLESEGSEWEKVYFNWVDSVQQYNETAETKKHVFFICHSFQLICRYYALANVCKRKSTAFGVFPVHMTDEGLNEPIFKGLGEPLYAVDSRDYQVIEPDNEKMASMGAAILAIEKERPHVPYERAVMAIRFSESFVGTQFHPEADAVGMSMYLQRDDKKNTVIENHGEEKWKSMIDQLNDPEKIQATYNHVLPNFLDHAVEQLAAKV